MAKALAKIRPIEVITVGRFALTENGLEVTGWPTFEEYQRAGDYIRRVHKASGWWLADWIVYGDSRPEWKELIDADMGIDQLAEQTVRAYRYLAKKIPPLSRLNGVSFAHHQAAVDLEPDARMALLQRALEDGWTVAELRVEVRKVKREGTLTGQALLEGMFHVFYIDPPWLYNDCGVITDRDAHGRAERHYPGMTIEQLCKLPVAAHALPNSVLFLWVTATMLLENPGPREVIEAWGFKPKASIVWDKVLHNFGHYVSIRHEHLLICTRGSCTPDHPTPMPDSVQTIRRGDMHDAKPEEFRRLITSLYDGPFCELFARQEVDNWTTWGNQVLADLVEARRNE